MTEDLYMSYMLMLIGQPWTWPWLWKRLQGLSCLFFSVLVSCFLLLLLLCVCFLFLNSAVFSVILKLPHFLAQLHLYTKDMFTLSGFGNQLSDRLLFPCGFDRLTKTNKQNLKQIEETNTQPNVRLLQFSANKVSTQITGVESYHRFILQDGSPVAVEQEERGRVLHVNHRHCHHCRAIKTTPVLKHGEESSCSLGLNKI